MERKTLQKLEITRSLNLNLNVEDWQWVNSQSRNPLTRPQVKPFDRQDALERLSKVSGELEWNRAQISISLSREESVFWFKAMSLGNSSVVINKQNFQKLVTQMSLESVTEELTIESLFPILLDFRWYRLSQFFFLPLSNLFPLRDLMLAAEKIYFLETYSAIEYINSAASQECVNWYFKSFDSNQLKEKATNIIYHKESQTSQILDLLLQGFKKFVYPYLTDTEILILRQDLSPVLNPSSPCWKHFYSLATYLGMRDEIKVLIESWPEKSNSKYLQLEIHDYRLRTIDIIFGLGNAQLVEQHIRRQNIGLARASDIRIWLAYTEYSALDWVCRSIIQSPDLLESFTEAIKAPEAAPYMLELWLSLKTPQLARQWLEDNPVEAIVGLIPVAAGNVHPPINVKPSEMSRGALDFLKSMKRKGFDSIIQAALERESPEIAERIRVKIFNSEDLSYIPFDSHNTPKWLTLQVNEFRKFNSTKVCTWVAPADLPLLIVEENSLNTEQVAMCLFALKQSTLDSPHPLIPNLKKHCNQHSLDAFAWSLFQRWLTEGAPSKEKWAMAALGLLGSDSIALKLTPLIRQYPAENQHLRAVFGLECLRAIGSDTALMQIHGIAQKVKYQGLKKRANECLQAIARERKLTKEQLEDRIIPDLGLDARGQRVFDFGARQFQFILGDDLKPRVRDEKGKLSTNLPKPGAKDNPELAHQAIADWKLLKKQIEQVVKIQSLRLEKAMIVERHWQWLEFESLLVRHPLMTNLVQRLVWGGYNSSGEMLGTFRVAEDQTYANESDEEFIPEGMMTVVVVHPLKLTDSERAAWTQAFSDYEIIPPFPQINREIYTLQPQESQEKEITRFKDILIPGLTLARKMEHLGWVRGRLHDHGDYRVHYKYFAKANVTAIIGDYENQHVEQSSIWGDDAIDGCCFFTGDFSPYEYPEPGSWYHRQTQKEHLLLGEIDPLVMSEVLRDLYTVTAKAK